MRSQFASAFGLGLVFAASPGSVAAEAVRRGIRGGLRPVLLLELGSLVGDATWAVLALSGSAFLVQFERTRVGLGAAGTVLLLWLAVSALRAGAPAAPTTKGGGRNDFIAGALLSLSNPANLVFWLGIGSALAVGAAGRPAAVVFFSGFMFACILWCPLAAATIASRPAFIRWANIGCGLALLALGLRLGWTTLRNF